MVAAVYLNRVRKGMLLQADPTVIYALKLEGRWNGNIRRADLSLDSPYNTYAKRGFPPGPIANPGLASLRAAVTPAQTDYLYFVSRNDGSHAFARTLAEHNRNVEEHQRSAQRPRIGVAEDEEVDRVRERVGRRRVRGEGEERVLRAAERYRDELRRRDLRGRRRRRRHALQRGDRGLRVRAGQGSGDERRQRVPERK